MSEYFSNIKNSAVTIATGMGITLKHFINAIHRKGDAGVAEKDYFNQVDGLCTLQYPKEAIPTPKIGRYRLHNDINDCIGCGQCVRACPISCIYMETIKVLPEDFAVCGKTSDGQQKKFWIPVFDIDVAKCMTCGICTTVCPTECLVHTEVSDFSEFDRSNFLYHFGNLTKDEAEAKKRKAAEAAAKAAAEKKAAGERPAPAAKPVPAAKPAPAANPGKKGGE
jgi:NADH-quinone oxidoreductase subunit I